MDQTVKGDGLPAKPKGTRAITTKAAARQLDVARELVEGLVIGGQIKGYRDVGRTGEPIVLVDVKDLVRIKELRERSAARRPPAPARRPSRP